MTAHHEAGCRKVLSESVLFLELLPVREPIFAKHRETDFIPVPAFAEKVFPETTLFSVSALEAVANAALVVGDNA